MTICHDIYLCSGTLGKQAIIERIVCMRPKVQPETIIFTNVPKKMKNCKTTLAFITLTTSSCQLPCFVIYLSFDQLFVVITFLGQSGSFGGCPAAKGEKEWLRVSSFANKFPKKFPKKCLEKILKSGSREVAMGGKGVIASFLSFLLFVVRMIIFFC